MAQTKLYIYGKHAVGEALKRAPHILRRVYLAHNFDDKKLISALRAAHIETEPLDSRKVTSMVEGNAPHQGIVALVSLGTLAVAAERFLETFQAAPNSLVVFLSDVQDPHNVGAIIRSAAAFGASAVVMPEHKQAPITGSVVKASAGAAFAVPLVVTNNMQQTLAQFKKLGFTLYGLAADSATTLQQAKFNGPTLIVVGNEAQGVAPAARALCDQMLSIAMPGGTESLNVAASAAVALYAWSTMRLVGSK